MSKKIEPQKIMENTNGRFAEVRKCREEISHGDIKTPDITDPDKISKKYPSSENFKSDMESAEIRRRVSEVMFIRDQELSQEDKKGIIERQINKHFSMEFSSKEVMGHVQMPHGVKPNLTIQEWCKQNNVTDYDEQTSEIGKATGNYIAYKFSRSRADLNNLSEDVSRPSHVTESSVFTKEYNLNALKAQRDLMLRVFEDKQIMDEDGKLTKPYMDVHIHGKVDTRGSDFEIAAAMKASGQAPIDERLVFWISDRLKVKIQEKGIRNSKGEVASVNVVTVNGSPYCGTYALTRLRYGDELFDFHGFGEMLQCLQLECGKFVRYNHTNDIAQAINEIIAEFTKEFQNKEDLQKIDSNKKRFEQKYGEEYNNFINPGVIGFSDAVDTGSVLLSNGVRDIAEVNVGETVLVNGLELKVGHMKQEYLKLGKKIMLHNSNEVLVAGKEIDIKKK